MQHIVWYILSKPEVRTWICNYIAYIPGRCNYLPMFLLEHPFFLVPVEIMTRIKWLHLKKTNFKMPSAVREINKNGSTFSATNISSNIVLLLQLHDTIQTKSNFATKFSSIYVAKWEKRLFFRLSFVNLQRAKDGTYMFDAKCRYVFVV